MVNINAAQLRFIDDEIYIFSSQALHNTYYRALAEIVAICLHGQPVNAYSYLLMCRTFFVIFIKASQRCIITGIAISCLFQYLLGNIVHPGGVTSDCRSDQVLWYIL